MSCPRRAEGLLKSVQRRCGHSVGPSGGPNLVAAATGKAPPDAFPETQQRVLELDDQGDAVARIADDLAPGGPSIRTIYHGTADVALDHPLPGGSQAPGLWKPPWIPAKKSPKEVLRHRLP